MIVRILTEGQYDVSDQALAALNQLDSALEGAVSVGDQAEFDAALSALLDGVRTVGVPRAHDALDESDIILPPADATMDDVRELLGDDGLIPG